jgi:hypothetical protein
MKVSRICAVIAITLSVSGCVSMMYGDKLVTEETRNTRVLDAAAFDFECDKNSVSITKINPTSYGAKGCGKKARYTMIHCGDMNWKTVCTAVVNGATHSGSGTSAQAVNSAAASANAANSAAAAANAASNHIMHHTPPPPPAPMPMF